VNILWFNWRDIKHPDAGGAEVFTHEIMSRLVKKGHNMTLFTASIPSGVQSENIDGVRIIRDGGKYTLYSKARKYYKRYNNNYNLIIDEINAKPFLNPKIANGKSILAIFHQLIKEEWFYETRFPLNYIYYYLEKRWLHPYKNTITITVSNSSRSDLESLGFNKVFVVPIGISVIPLANLCKKECNPTVAFIGRLKKHKLPHHAIEAFLLIKKEIPNAKMWIIGDGELYSELKKYDTEDVIFYGHVENDLKYDLLSKVHIVLVPSVREGWGLIVTESNAMGTPVIGYNVPGLKDSIKDRVTGILTEENSPKSLADCAVSLLRDQTLLSKYSTNSLEYSKRFSWDKTADIFDEIINTIS
jgi:glycosyltransferase involved in cell wall biosynthesis